MIYTTVSFIGDDVAFALTASVERVWIYTEERIKRRARILFWVNLYTLMFISGSASEEPDLRQPSLEVNGI